MKKLFTFVCIAAALLAPPLVREASAAGAYTVRFYANGGTGTMAKQSFSYGKAKRLRANAFKRSGYVFAGWAKAKAGKPVYKDRQSVKNLAKPGKTRKLFAVWAKRKYKVAFVKNGGTGTMAGQAFVYGKAQKLRANAFKRAGYTFAGWAKSAAGGVAYKNGQSVKNLTLKGGTVKLYASWKGQKATYSFDANGGSGTMASQAFVVGTAQALRPNAFKRSGCVFLGWAKSADGTVAYADAQKLSTPASTGGKAVKLYAVWGGSMATVPGGTNAGSDPDFGAYSLSVPTFLMDRTEVTWGQWKAVRAWGLAHGYAFENDGAGKGADHPVYGVSWYDCLKWCNARSEMEGLAPAYITNGKVYRTGRSVPAAPGNGPGYRLPTDTEWEYAARGGLRGARFPFGEYISHEFANYQAKSSLFDMSDGLHPAYSSGSYPYTAPVGRFKANGYGLRDMAGNVAEWVWDVVSPGRGLRGGGWGSDDCRCGYRNWKDPTTTGEYVGFRTVRRPAYAVRFSANGGAGSMADLSNRTPGADVKLPACAFTRENKDFLGWSTDAAATAATWADGATVKGGFLPPTGSTIVLYAVWGPRSYYVAFDRNGGSGTMAKQRVLFGEAGQALSPNLYTMADCAFLGWSTSKTGAVAYADGAAVDAALEALAGGRSQATVFLYAQWARNAYYVSFKKNADGVIGSMPDQRMLFGVGASLDTNAFVRVGWVFGGWATNATGAAVYADGAAVTNLTSGESIELYATWWGGMVRVEGTPAVQDAAWAEYGPCSPFLMDATETTIENWNAVRDWALENGYEFSSPTVGAAKGPAHPVQSVSWYDCAKWCNARSEMEGLEPVYTLSGGTVYRQGSAAPDSDPSKSGYRLPSKDEWGLAASGGVSGKRYPWGTDDIDHARANYTGANDGLYDLSDGPHPDFVAGGAPYTAPVGSFDPTGSADAANCFFYDLAGNVAEWDGEPPNGDNRAARGGGWNDGGTACQWNAVKYLDPAGTYNDVGFRTVRTAPAQP